MYHENNISVGMLAAAVYGGQMNVVKWLHAKDITPYSGNSYDFNFDYIYRHKCTLKWYLYIKKSIETFPLINYGNLSVLKWVCKSKRYTPTIKTLSLCASEGNETHKLHMLKWLLSRYKFTTDDLFELIKHARTNVIVNFLKTKLQILEK